MLRGLPSVAPVALRAASAALVRSEIRLRSFRPTPKSCIMKRSASRPNSATKKGTAGDQAGSEKQHC
jgi:hypothetical protein